MWQASEKLLEHIKAAEGYKTKAYLCPAGRWTCGYGHTKGVTRLTTCDRDKAARWLEEDLQPVVAFCNAIKGLNTQGRFDAIVDFGYNLGLGQLRSSTLLKVIQKGGTDMAVCAELRKWVYADGRRMPGLAKRRAWECERWMEK